MSRAQINGALIALLIVAAFCASIWSLSDISTDTGFTDSFGTLHALCFHICVACGAAIVLVWVYLDPIPLDVQYTVMGEPPTNPACYSFVHGGRWTTFTVWCATVSCAYFWCAAACSATLVRGGTVPTSLLTAVKVLWEIAFPMAFLVNLVVTFVLIPGFKKQAKFDKVWGILMPRPQLLHNGFVVAAALEAVVVGPPLPLRDVPIIVLFGLTYAVFAYALFAVTGIFHYFFMDYRFKFAPCGILGLLFLVTALYLAGSVAVTASAHTRAYGAAILLAALSTCTFRDAAAVCPSEFSQSLQSVA